MIEAVPPVATPHVLESSVRDTTANPAPLGLLAFGMTTVLLNLVNAGWFPLSTMVLAMGLFYGGLAQMIAGIMEWRKGNTFGTTAFLSFGSFWLTLVGLIVLPRLGWGDAATPPAMTAYLGVWGVFTLVMWFGTWYANRALQFVFLSLAVLFFLLSASEATGSKPLHTLAGWEGIVCGASAMYAALAQVLNEHFGRTVWSMGTIVRR